MLQYKKIDVSEGIETNKTSALKECMLCHYWYFKDIGYKFEKHVWWLLINIKKIAILNGKGVDYRCILRGISKYLASNTLNNTLSNNGFWCKWNTCWSN